MKGLLIRVGIDHAYGHWNAPVDPVSREFVYVPIPEESDEQFRPGLERSYPEVIPALNRFCARFSRDLAADLKFPENLKDSPMHLDPDFEELTYGDVGDRRGKEITKMTSGDLLVFYASLRPASECEHKLVYGLIGLYVVEEVVSVSEVPKDRWKQNAHTRRASPRASDIVVRAKMGASGRLGTCIPVGEWRDRAYRIRHNILDAWGGLTVKEGYVQRSAVPPAFLNPEQFYRWFQKQGIGLLQRNN